MPAEGMRENNNKGEYIKERKKFRDERLGFTEETREKAVDQTSRRKIKKPSIKSAEDKKAVDETSGGKNKPPNQQRKNS